MGHSFFVPIANEFKQHPPRCGLPDHKQFTKGGAAAQGAPGNMWNRIPAGDPVRKAIEAGQVDTLVVTYYPGSGSELADYERWIEIALKGNPKTRFFIVAPWPPYNKNTLAEFEKQWETHHGVILGLVDQLRKSHPNVEIVCIPEGKGVVELRRLLEKNQLPELAGICKADPQGKTGEFLFSDTFGHGDKMIHNLLQLIWLSMIYKVDVRNYEWDTGFKQIDLRALAWQVAQEGMQAAAKK